jgi:hypothetical protein
MMSPRFFQQLQVSQHLGGVNRRERLNGLQLHQDQVLDEHVCAIARFQFYPAINERDRVLERYGESYLS